MSVHKELLTDAQAISKAIRLLQFGREVTFCKNCCAYASKSGWCSIHRREVEADDYCSWAIESDLPF